MGAAPVGGTPDAARAWRAVAAALLEGLHDAAWIADQAQQVVAANAAAERFFGVDRGALCARAVTALAAAPEDFAFWAEVADGGPAATEGLESETLVRDGGDRLRPVLRRVSRLQLVAGEACYLVQLRDLAAQRAADAQHSRRLSQLNAILEATGDGILVTDLHGRIVNFNQRFAAMWALPEEATRRGHDDLVLSWLQRSVVDAAAYMRRLAAIDDASDAPTRDTLQLRSGRVIERVSLPQRCDGRAVGRVWSFREARSRPG